MQVATGHGRRGLRFVPVDFEDDELASGLTGAGLDLDSPACFVWLGVAPYLTREAFESTLALTGRCAGSEVVFDYAEPVELLAESERRSRDAAMERVASVGEPWQLFMTVGELAATLAEHGFDEIDDIGSSDFRHRFFGDPAPQPHERRPGGHLVHVRRR